VRDGEWRSTTVLPLLERLKPDGIDHDEAIQSCNVVFQNAPARQLLLRAAELEAAEFIREYLHCVGAVSDALLVGRTLDGDQVEGHFHAIVGHDNSSNRRSEKFASECLRLTGRE
jgi:hypothetical protein